MLKLEDFFHLPPVDALIEQLVADGAGLVVVAGLDPRPTVTSAGGEGFLPSGRSTMFRILVREMLAAHHPARSIVIAEDREAIRIPRELRRVELALVQPPYTYAGRIADAIRQRPALLVIDRLCAETAAPALDAAQQGIRVLSQLDTVFQGAAVARHLLDLGAAEAQLDGLAWVLAVQRLATLCPHCRRPAPPEQAQLDRLRQHYPHFDRWPLPSVGESDEAQPSGVAAVERGTYFRAEGCVHCQHSGRQGDVVLFDIFHADSTAPDRLEQPSLLPMEAYAWHLALLGHLSLEDVIQFGADQLRRTFGLLITSERALLDSNAALERKLAELEVSNRVLQQRTKALISLQEFGQALITSTDLDGLAARVCRRALELCGADRAILYFLGADERAEVLSVGGWDPALIHRQVDARAVLAPGGSAEPTRYDRWPPGVPPSLLDGEGATLRDGLYVPLTAQEQQIGLLIVHTTQKHRFAPGEVALLQAFANQAALALQRAGLIEQLQTKIAQLEAAQVELAQKERIEHELELARQVQQSVLPRTFPHVPGYRFAARNEPARQVGGDFYDVIALDADHFGLAVADVSGKGMPAALYMALTRSLLLAEARRARSPRAVIASVNQLLLELGEPDMFVTVFYGVVERATRQLTYACAGHDHPFLLREETAHELPSRGTVLGLLDQHDLHLSEEQIVLAPGDRLALYTDGLIDVQNPDGQLWDRAQLRSLLQAHAGRSAAELCAATFTDLAAYQENAEQYDDMTLLVLQVE